MSTSFQQMYEKWVEDNAAFLAQAQEVQNGVAQIYGNGSPSNPGDLAAFKAKLDKMDVSASYALMLLFYILGASSQNSTLLGYYTDKSGLTGERLKLNGLLTKVDNDLNNMAQSNSSHSSDMVLFCQATDTVLNELNGGDPNLNPNAAYPSMDPEAQLSVYNQLLQIRQLFYLGNDAPYDPTGDSYYFAPNGTGTKHINTFQEFEELLKQQGDPQGASSAAKALTDDFGINTQTTQTASAVLNNDQKTYTSMEQATQSFIAAIAQWWNTLAKQANSHMTSS